jgi:periplasmic protein CpxP/Spy
MREYFTKKMVGGLALAAVLSVASLAVFGNSGHAGGDFGFAQGGPRGGHGPGHGRGPEVGGHRGGNPLGRFARDLDLTDAQKAEIKRLTDAFEAGTKPLHEQLFNARGGHGGEFREGAFDEAAVRAEAQSRAAVHVELEVAHARLMSQVYALLTPEQKAQVAERRQQFEQRRREFESRKGAEPGAR